MTGPIHVRMGAALACLVLLSSTSASQSVSSPAGGPGSAVIGGPVTAQPGPRATADAPSSGTAASPTVGAATPTGTASASATTPAAKSTPGTTLKPTPTRAPTPEPTPHRTAKPTPKAPPPVSACRLFGVSNVWNRRVDSLPARSDSATLIGTIGAGKPLHPDFGSYAGYGIPYNVVGAGTPTSKVTFDYADESDAGPYPIPATPRIEAGGDRHLLIWDTAACRLYELYAAEHTSDGWHAGSGAIWNLRSNALRPDGWTSADAAGLPILPGLVRYDELAAGAINHAIRFTAPVTRSAHIYPARHDAGAGGSAALPPMGLRVRLKAGFDMSKFSPRMRVILVAMQRYGMILADNGSSWFFSGASDSRWNDDELNQLKALSGADFEAVNTTGFVNG